MCQAAQRQGWALGGSRAAAAPGWPAHRADGFDFRAPVQQGNQAVAPARSCGGGAVQERATLLRPKSWLQRRGPGGSVVRAHCHGIRSADARVEVGIYTLSRGAKGAKRTWFRDQTSPGVESSHPRPAAFGASISISRHAQRFGATAQRATTPAASAASTAAASVL